MYNLWNTLQFHNIGYPTDVPSHHSDKQMISLYNLNFTMTVVYLTDAWGFRTTSEEWFYSKVCLQSHVSIRLTMKISKTSICCSLSAKNRYSDLNHWAHTVNAICWESALDNLRPWCVQNNFSKKMQRRRNSLDDKKVTFQKYSIYFAVVWKANTSLALRVSSQTTFALRRLRLKDEKEFQLF